MTIMDELKDIAKRVGVDAKGSTIQEIISSFKKGLDEKEKRVGGKQNVTQPLDRREVSPEENYQRSKDRPR